MINLGVIGYYISKIYEEVNAGEVEKIYRIPE